MPSPAALLLAATLLPLVGFAVLLFVGKRMGSPIAGWVGTSAMGGSFLCTLAAMYQWYLSTGTAAGPWGWNRSAIHLAVRWLPVGDGGAGGAGAGGVGAGSAADHPGWLDVGLYVDSLTVAMFAMITVVALLVHVFSIGYIRNDIRFSRFFTYLSLFCFAMLALVLSGSLLQIFIFWEGVGFCSYLLIGFWFEKKPAARAALKAFVVNRVGDFAFLIGFGMLFYFLGNASLPQVWLALGSAGEGGDVSLPGGAIVPALSLTLIGVFLFLGAAGKSAQFPLHTWLPDAMEGPTPVSALIHAATMVAAGVYLMGRLFPILTPDAKLVIAIIGCITLSLGALIALVQTDIKKVLAYSTISQLGYMMLAIGVGSWIGALFHLITHAFFKSLLFLGSGSVIHAAHHEQEMTQYGGLMRRIPVTAFSFGIAVLAISGAGVATWGLSGYYSKANILTDSAAFAQWTTEAGRSSSYWLLFTIPAVVAYLTPFYMTRCWMLTFAGKPRNDHLYEHARETPMMYVPLLALAVLSVIGGWGVLSVRDLLRGSLNESTATVRQLAFHTTPTTLSSLPPAATQSTTPFSGFSTAWPAMPPITEPTLPASLDPLDAPVELQLTTSQRAHQQGHHLEHRYVGWAWLIGIALAVAVYVRGFSIAERVVRVKPIGWIHTWLLRKMYFDELYETVLVAPVLFLTRLAGWIDRSLVDGAVNAAAWATRQLAFGVGWHDRRVIDGAVAAVGRSALELGVAVRRPQNGRIRVYVTTLMLVIVAGLAVTVAVMMWPS